MALRLLLRLLHWEPASRPSAKQVGGGVRQAHLPTCRCLLL
jgi:hypothetical protein